MDQSINTEEQDLLARAEDLVRELQAGNERKVNQILEHISSAREYGLFQEVGKMTRQLHDSLNTFRTDSRLDSLAQHDIPDAQERLRYVITMTEKAAETTLNAVEDSMPRCVNLVDRSGALQRDWARFKERKMSADEFRALSHSIESFLAESHEDAAVVKEHLNRVLLAQDFQDLTGQIIKRVITLVEEVEGNLVELVRITGTKFTAPADEEALGITAVGPRVPGVDEKGTVSGQDEVDDLLSSLGF